MTLQGDIRFMWTLTIASAVVWFAFGYTVAAGRSLRACTEEWARVFGTPGGAEEWCRRETHDRLWSLPWEDEP
jgi:hypothetical protein